MIVTYLRQTPHVFIPQVLIDYMLKVQQKGTGKLPSATSLPLAGVLKLCVYLIHGKVCAVVDQDTGCCSNVALSWQCAYHQAAVLARMQQQQHAPNVNNERPVAWK